MPNKTCPVCGCSFEADNNAQIYCSRRCRSKNQAGKMRSQPGHWLTAPIPCGFCGKEFIRAADSSPNRKYCSDECTLRGAIRSANRFHELNPKVMAKYNRQRYQKYGTDNLTNRLRKKYPDLPTICESAGCNEGRVLEFAHRPEFKRNGAFRVMKHYERHMFWVLCPTCHKLIDYGICTPSELGLV